MTLQETVLALRKQALAQRRKPTPDAYQGITKDRIEAVLRAIDRYTLDQRDAVFALLDDVSPSFYSLQYKNFPPHITLRGITTQEHPCGRVGIRRLGSIWMVGMGRVVSTTL